MFFLGAGNQSLQHLSIYRLLPAAFLLLLCEVFPLLRAVVHAMGIHDNAESNITRFLTKYLDYWNHDKESRHHLANSFTNDWHFVCSEQWSTGVNSLFSMVSILPVNICELLSLRQKRWQI